MPSSSDWLLRVILQFYEDNPDALRTVYEITNHQYAVPQRRVPGQDDAPKLSVRVVNWFVGNYAKQHMTAYSVFAPDGSDSAGEASTKDGRTQFHPSVSAAPPPGYKADRFIVWNRYCTAKKGYHSKDLFDPYCRRNRITLQCGEGGETFETTVGQLNFFKWAIQTHVIDYVVYAYDDVVRDMSTRLAKVDRTRGATASGEAGEEEAGAVGAGSVGPANARAKRVAAPGATTRRKKREELSVAACRCLKTISLRAEPDLGITPIPVPEPVPEPVISVPASSSPTRLEPVATAWQTLVEV